MYRLKLIKALSYSGIVTATKTKPFVIVPEKEQAEYLVSTGYFELVEGEGATTEKADENSEQKNSDELLFPDEEEAEKESPSVMVELQKKTKDELVAYAGMKGIDLTGCNKKDEIFQRIVQELARADEARNFLRN